ncbi:caprin-1-like [Cimex lectularius]|uniref:Caprin-1 dimerization domain-containing protein n=1 Tax=Cimex lectularius TaxID=79782 RepID=A0A8I6SJQ1_CIMLE|nr:caprin-1-like [Cimex lectularius]
MQDVLTNMGTDAIREDFLQGKCKVTLTQEELQSIDDLYVELTPKKEEPRAFVDMFQTPAETMVALIDGKNKEAFGTTYSALKAKLLEVATSGYFDTLAPAPLAEEPPVAENVSTELTDAEKIPEMIPVEQIEEMNLRQLNEQTPVQNVQSCSFQPTGAKPMPLPQVMTPQDQFNFAQQVQPEVMPGAPSIETTYFTPSHLRVFKSGTIDFMQVCNFPNAFCSETFNQQWEAVA